MLIPGILIAVVVAAYEGINHYMFSMKSDYLLIQSLSFHDEFITKVEILALLRYCVFITVLTLALFVDLPHRPHETLQSLKESNARLKTAIEKMVSARVSKSLIVTDDELRKPYFENLTIRSSRTLASMSLLKKE